MSVVFLSAPKETGLIAVDKPPGVTVIPGRAPEQGPSLRELVQAALGQPVWVVHRLDRDTSGVVLFALDAETHRTASMAFEAHQVDKRYLALVQGRVARDNFEVDLPLVEARKRRMKVAQGVEGKPALTRFRCVQRFAQASLVECQPRTGRQHQIRVHLASQGHPLLFDHQYGRKEPLKIGAVELRRTPLHAASVELPRLGFRAEAPLAADLRAVVDALSGG